MLYRSTDIYCQRRGSGPPVLFIHGNPATHSLWNPVVERLLDSRTLYALDLPGFGGSPPPEDPREYALEELARIIIAFADYHHLERFDLVGHSFGSAVAIAVTVLVRERVRSLALITPMIDKLPRLGRLARMRLFRALGNAAWRNAPGGLRRGFTRRWTRISYGDGFSQQRSEEVAAEADRPDLVAPMCGLMAAADPDRYRSAIEQLGTMNDLPLMLIGAGRDRIIPCDDFNQLCNRLPGAAHHIFPNGGHVPMYQYPDEVTALLITFWTKA